jgi:hypothetical protein
MSKAYSVGTGGAVQLLSEVSIVDANEDVKTYLFGVSGGVPFMLEVSGGELINSDTTLSGVLSDAVRMYAAERGGKLYIADPDGIAKVLDPSTGTLSTYSDAPGGCGLICRYRDRIVLAKDNTWYMSRKGDPTDFNFVPVPVDKSMALMGPLSYDGIVGHNITALMCHSDDFLLFGCVDSIWQLEGDLASEGRLSCLSKDVGVISGDAWCRLPDGSMMVLSHTGLYVVAPGQAPKSFSREALPRELLEVDADDAISMCYDVKDDGVHLSITPDVGSGTHWWIDLRAGGFWPVSYGSSVVQPTAMHALSSPLSLMRKVVVGCADGYLRVFDDDAQDDDGHAFTGYVMYGPIRAKDAFSDVKVTGIASTLDAGGGSVTWTVQAGDYAEQAISDPQASDTGTFRAGRSYRGYPSIAGGAVAVKLSGASIWASEGVSLAIEDFGKQGL